MQLTDVDGKAQMQLETNTQVFHFFMSDKTLHDKTWKQLHNYFLFLNVATLHGNEYAINHKQ